MRNLQVVINPKISFGEDAIGQCIDFDNRILYILTKELHLFSTKICSDRFSSGIKRIAIDIDDEISEKLYEPTNELRAFEFIVESGSILVASKDGHLIRIGVSSFSPETQCIHIHDKPISSVKLSPSQDLIALADEDNNLHLLSIDGQLISSSNALSEQESLHKPVGVGWGSKETQFFGLDGRLSREEESKNETILSDTEKEAIENIESSMDYKEFRRPQERATTIDWRGDGQYLATLTYLSELGKHSLKIWNRNLELQYMSENLVSVERGLISWIPNGQHVCCVQRRNKIINEIAIFEKNGMIHQRITLPGDNLPWPIQVSYVKDISWSHDSKVMACVLKEFPSGEEILLLYTMQNSRYYLKFFSRLDFPCLKGLNFSLRWDSVHLNRFHIVASQGSYSEYICSSHVTYSQDSSTVAVLDGNKIYITPFDHLCVPPPMSAFTIQAKKPITNVTISYKSANDVVFASDGVIFSTREAQGENGRKRHTRLGEVRTQEENGSNGVTKHYPKIPMNLKLHQGRFKEKYGHWQHMTIIWEDLVAVSHNTEGGSAIYTYDHLVDGNELSPEDYVKRIGNWSRKKISYITYHQSSTEQPNENHHRTGQPCHDCLAVLFDDGSCLSIDKEGYEKLLFENNNESEYHYTDAKMIYHSEFAVISLGQDLTLRLNSTPIVANSCTSFRITTNYLIYTTTDNMLHFVLLKNIRDAKSWSQPIESGGTLVVASELQSKLVLQMPRGNLEIIQPRVLIFSMITRLLVDRNYVGSMRIARKHRLDTNFLFDYLLRLVKQQAGTSTGEHIANVSTVSHAINDFVNEIASDDPSLLNNLISELDNTDTVVGKYGEIMKHIPLAKDERSILEGDKVNQICGFITLPLDIKYLQPRLLILLKKKPREIGHALCIVNNLDLDSQREALKFMLYFIDIDQLFLEALSTYRTEIALMVASASNKDPKEYLILLSGFDKIECKLERAYEIDMYTKNYEKALEHSLELLQKAHTTSFSNPSIIRVVDLVTSKRLYKEAVISLADMNDKNYRPPTTSACYLVWSNYGKYLFEKRHYSEAATAYSKAYCLRKDIESFDKAMRCYQLAGDWKRPLALLARSSIDSTAKQKFYEGITNQLFEQNQHCEAALLASMPMCKVPSNFIEKLLDRGDWYLAESLAEDPTEQSFRGALVQSLSDHLNLRNITWSNELQTAVTQFDRLKQLLTSHRERRLHDNLDHDLTISDSISTFDGSEASSESPGDGLRRVARSGASSIKTRHTSKSNRSQALKKMRINLRPGSRNEDIALIQELKKFIVKQKARQVEAVELCAAQYEYRRLKSARIDVKATNELVYKAFKLSKEMSETLWPQARQEGQIYSLYERFMNVMNVIDGHFENILFEVLLKPELPNDFYSFEI